MELETAPAAGSVAPAIPTTNGQAIAELASNPARAVAIAMDRGDLEQVAKFMDLQERYEKNEARKAYVAAMALFKQNPPEIIKRKRVAFLDVDYKHATLADVCTAAIEGLAKVGISHAWDTKVTGTKVVVTCILTHEKGHKESTELPGEFDNTGKKNALQQMGSTITYLQRYTLKMITGLAEADDDDDGKGGAGGPGKEPDPTLSEDQIANIEALLTEVGANRRAFLAWCKVAKLSEILARNYKHIVREIEARRQRQ